MRLRISEYRADTRDLNHIGRRGVLSLNYIHSEAYIDV
jgi:hypothetical protein